MKITKSKVIKNSSKNKDFITQINFLCNAKSSEKNNKILTEYFFNKFSKSPILFKYFMLFIKEHFNTLDNKLKKVLANKYLYILSLLCERFWLYEDKLILDDMCFEIINKNEYDHISSILTKYKINSKKIIEQIYVIFKNKLEEHNIKYTIKWRYKNIFSIYKKCKKKWNMNILKLWDIFAFRIIIDWHSEKCFDVLNILHNNFSPIVSRFKDYISIPKINGYQSLHTWLLNVISDLDLAIEVQIRNIRMDEVAELWIAAHFLYWINKKSTIVNKREEKLFKYITNSYNKSYINNIIHCLTPKLDIIVLKEKSNIIDFANKIHTELWKKAKYAIVNWKKKKLIYKIKNYDIIKIIV